MDAKVNYTIVGLIGIILVAALIAFLIWVLHPKSNIKYKIYVSYFKQDVSGLSKSSQVRVNGINFGFVDSISLDKKNITKVRVVFKIDEAIPVTTQSYAIIKSQGLTGEEYVALETKNPNAPLLKKQKGEKYLVIPTQASLLTTLEDQLKETSGEIKILVKRANDLLNKNNRENVDKTLASIEKVTQTIANNSDKINASIVSMKKILDNTRIASKNFPNIAQKTVETMDAIEKLAAQLSKTGNKATLTLTKTNSAVQNITNQLLPNAQQLMQQLNQMIATLNQFGKELSHNPSMLIRGKYPSPPGPGEK